MNIIIGFLLFFGVFATDAFRIKKRIIGGVNVRPNEIPYHTSLNVNGVYICGATLITKLHLLTAAHCLDRLISLGTGIRYNIKMLVATLFQKYGIPFEVKRISHHKSFNRSSIEYTLPNDIGIIHLKRPIMMTLTVGPIGLPSNATRVSENQEVLVSGFGSQDGTGKPAGRLSKIVLRITTLQKCQAEAPIYKLNEHNICAISKPNVGCSYGDDGSAMTDIEQKVILGILSVSKGCAGSQFPDIFTNVLHYLDYINEELHYDFDNVRGVEHPGVNYISEPQPSRA